jgi:dienelactone hydrolase
MNAPGGFDRPPTPEEIARMEVVLDLPGTADVVVRQNIPYRIVEGETLTFDLYLPPGRSDTPRPVVLFMMGFPDRGMQAILGRRAKEMGSYTSWARLVAASGMAAINFSNRQPADDVYALLQHLRDQADPLGVDPHRIAVWSCSGNVPAALSVLIAPQSQGLRCAALFYGYMLDIDGSTLVADMARAMHFANPAAGRPLSDLPPRLPIFIARAGADQTPHLNETIDRFVAAALRANLPITVANHPTGPHAFDLMEDSAVSREIIRRVLDFLRHHLGVAG